MPCMIHRILSYWDLNQSLKLPFVSRELPVYAAGDGSSKTEHAITPEEIEELTKKKSIYTARHKTLSVGEQLIMYFGTVIGVLFSSAITSADATPFQLAAITPSSVMFALIVALVIMPIEFKQLGIKRNTPAIIRLGIFVQSGVFWQVLLGFGHALITSGVK